MKDAKHWADHFFGDWPCADDPEEMESLESCIRIIQRDAIEAAAKEVAKDVRSWNEQTTTGIVVRGIAKRIRNLILKDTDHAR